MTLFHYTSLPHLEEIIRSEVILPTESNIGAPWKDSVYPYGTHAGPPVVHLMDSPTPFGFDHGLTGVRYDKRQARFEVKVPGIDWDSWEWTQKMSPRWREILEKQAGIGASKHWRVFPAPIRQKRWASIGVRQDDTTPLPEAYKSHLGEPDEYGYRPLSDFLIEAINLVPIKNVRPPQ